MAKVSEDLPAIEEHPAHGEKEAPRVKDPSPSKDKLLSSSSNMRISSNVSRHAANSESDDDLSPLIDEHEHSDQVDSDNEENKFHKSTKSEIFELADIVEIEIQGGRSSSLQEDMGPSLSSHAPDPLRYSTIAGRTAKLANEAKNERVVRQMTDQSKGSSEKNTRSKKLHTTSSLDEDVAHVDKLLIKLSFWVISCWIALVAFSYWIVPAGSIQWYEGTERNAALVELSILSTAVIMKFFSILVGD